MIALKMLLMVAGVLMLAAAVAIPLYGLWLRIQYARRKTGADETMYGEPAVEPEEIAWRGPLALAMAGLPAAACRGQHRGGAQRHGRRAHQPA